MSACLPNSFSPSFTRSPSPPPFIISESLVKGWQLFAICTGAFPPSAEFEPYLMSYLDKHRNDPLVGAYATFSLGRVAMATNLGPRREVPTQIEVEAVKEMKAVVMRVYNLDGSYNNVPVTSWTTMEHLNDMMAVLLGLKNKEAFACYEMTSDVRPRRAAGVWGFYSAAWRVCLCLCLIACWWGCLVCCCAG